MPEPNNARRLPTKGIVFGHGDPPASPPPPSGRGQRLRECPRCGQKIAPKWHQRKGCK